jgi:hypothetical protein
MQFWFSFFFFFFVRDGPLLVVASGRDTISIASSIKCLAPDNVFVVQVKLYPFFQKQNLCLIVMKTW